MVDSRSLTTLIVSLLVCSLGVPTARAEPAELISRNNGGTAGNQVSSQPYVAKNGRFIFFSSNASNLVATDTTTVRDVYLADRELGTLEHLKLGHGALEIAAEVDLFGVSANGRYVGFFTRGDAFVPGFQPNGSLLGYVHDRKTNQTHAVTQDHSGNAITEDLYNISLAASGKYVVFTTAAPYVVEEVASARLLGYVHDLSSGETELVTLAADDSLPTEDTYSPRISADGRRVFFSTMAELHDSDTNLAYDVYCRDRKSGKTRRVSLGVEGQIDGSIDSFEITPDGNHLVFATSGDVLGDGGTYLGMYRRDLVAKETRAVATLANGKAPGGLIGSVLAVDHSGRCVAFASYAPNLVTPDLNGSIYDIFVADSKKNTIELVSKDLNGLGVNDDCVMPALSADGHVVTFASSASDFVATATFGKRQVYAVDR